MSAPHMPQSSGLHGLPELRALLDTITPIQLLVDPGGGEPAPAIDVSIDRDTDLQTQREAAWRRPVAQIALPARVPSAPHTHPYLVELQGLDDPLLAFTLELAHDERAAVLEGGLQGQGGAGHSIGGWLQTSMHLPQLAQALAPMMRVNTSARTQSTYLRVPDRRVLALLRHVAGDARIAGQFGRLNRWVYLDTQGRLAVLHSPGEQTTALLLDPDEWAYVQLSPALHRTIALWLGEAALMGDPRPGQISALGLFAPAHRAVMAAQAAAGRWPHRFTRPIDQTVWAALSLLHPEVADHAAVHALLQDTGSAQDPPEPMRYLHPDIRALLPTAGAAPAQPSPRAPQ